jgi:hypothetical protein
LNAKLTLESECSLSILQKRIYLVKTISHQMYLSSSSSVFKSASLMESELRVCISLPYQHAVYPRTLLRICLDDQIPKFCNFQV